MCSLHTPTTKEETKDYDNDPKIIKSHRDLFTPGNVSIARVLIALADAGERGITTKVLLEDCGISSSHGQEAIKRAHDQGLIKRVDVPRARAGLTGRGNRQLINLLTDKGRALIQSGIKS